MTHDELLALLNERDIGCEKKLMQRKYSLGGIVLKGDGWGSK